MSRQPFRPHLAPGSTLWLLAHELRLGFRTARARRGGRAWIAIVALGAVMVLGGVPLGFALRHVQIPINPAAALLVDGGLVVVFTLMLSQTLAGAAEALYQRGDLDLMFSSPLPPRRTLTVRFLALATNVFTAFAALISALLLPVALIGHPAWLAVYGVLASLALLAVSAGLVLAMGLFALIGPRRTRTVAQLMAALIGAAFFLASQARNILGGAGAANLGGTFLRLARRPDLTLPPGADWPLRALTGEPLPLAVMLGAGGLVFFSVVQRLSRRFAANASAASGADAATGRRRRGRMRFARGAFAATLTKELRLLWRDAALLSQVFLRVLYLIPLGFVLIRNAGAHQDLLLPGGAAALVLFAGQVAGSLAWITISGEDAPDLLASAPTAAATFRQAKLTAALLPLILLLAPILAVLAVYAPLTALAAAAGSIAVALGTGLINIWHQKPGKRAEFLRRRGSSWLAATMELVLGLLIAAATGMAAAGWWLAAVPAALALALLAALRRSDDQIAKALASVA